MQSLVLHGKFMWYLLFEKEATCVQK